MILELPSESRPVPAQVLDDRVVVVEAQESQGEAQPLLRDAGAVVREAGRRAARELVQDARVALRRFALRAEQEAA